MNLEKENARLKKENSRLQHEVVMLNQRLNYIGSIIEDNLEELDLNDEEDEDD